MEASNVNPPSLDKADATADEGTTSLASQKSVMRDAGPPPDLLKSGDVECAGIHINDESVLPSFDVMVQKDHHFGMEDGDFDNDDDDEEKEEGRLLDAFSRWQDHRGSSRLRMSATPNDPEEDDDDNEKSDRFVSGIFANTSSNPSVMNSLLVQAGGGGGASNHKQVDEATTTGTASSAASVATAERTGFNMKQYEEELIKLRNDNFSLKLRIRLLEERQGLALRPGDSDARENVFGVNLDLRVEKETLKQQIDEKNKLLAQAAAAIEELEKEKSRIEQDYNAHICPPYQQHQHSESPERAGGGDGGGEQEEEEVDVSQRELLMKAFGSMNLGAQTEDAAKDDGGGASLRNFEELEKLQRELDEERARVGELQAAVAHKEEEIIDMVRDKEHADQHLMTIKGQHEAEIVDLSEELETKHMECVQLRTDFDAKEEQLIQLLEQMSELEGRAKAQHEMTLSTAGQEADNFQQQIAVLKNNFMQDRAQRDDEWREKCHGLSATIESVKKSLAQTQDSVDTLKEVNEELKENLHKTQLSVTGLSELNAELKQQYLELEAGVDARDKALAVLREEYEKLKARYRKKMATGNNQTTSLRSSTSSMPDNDSNVENKENYVNLKKGSVDRQEVLLLHEEELRLANKEIDLLKGELRLCKETFMRSGASKAVEAVEAVYKDQLTVVEGHHNKIVFMMRKRLEELADCLQKMLNVNRRFSVSAGAADGSSSFLDVSVMSESVLDASKSFLGTDGDGAANETQLPESVFHFPADKIMKVVDQSVCCDGQQQLSPVTLKMMAADRLKEYDSLMAELRDSAKQRLNVEGQALSLRRELETASAEVKEAKMAVAKSDRGRADLQSQLAMSQQKALDLQNQLADTGANLDGLRIKNGQLKEALAKMNDEAAELRAAAANRSRVHQAEEKIRQTEAQHKILLDKYAKSKEYADLLIKEVESYKETEFLLKSQLASQEDADEVKRQLVAANEKLAAYKDRQDAMEKTLKHQLAKTHVVLKKTKSSIQDQNKRPPLRENIEEGPL